MNTEEMFAAAPSEWVLPITQKPGDQGGTTHWQQQEYVACMQCGFSFSGHRSGQIGVVWHYKLPTPGGWAYYSLENPGTVTQKTIKADVRNPFMRDRNQR